MIDFNYTILIQFANLLILMILLNFLLFKPVLRAINKREEAIGSHFDNALSTKEQVNSLKISYEDGIKEKKKPIVEVKDAVLNEAHTAATQIIEQARTDLTNEISRIRIDIDNDSKKVRNALKLDVERLSNEAAQKILKRSFS
ncbi:MAG: ATP synthase F0 subunit B [Proteobacteria bacterium]|nr:ATP synthase F0 subunit B [Pseudomonadota bacterium]